MTAAMELMGGVSGLKKIKCKDYETMKKMEF